MTAEQLQRRGESARTQRAQQSRRTTKRRMEDSSDLEAHPVRDFDPIRRLDQLEAQVVIITRQLQERDANGYNYTGLAYEDRLPGTTSLLARIEALEKRVDSHGTPSHQTPHGTEDNTHPSRPGTVPTAQTNSEEVAQLRFHVATLANQLARAEGVLKEVQGTPRVRRWRRGGHSWPRWMFWRRRRRR